MLHTAEKFCHRLPRWCGGIGGFRSARLRGERGLAGQQVVQRGSQTVDIGGRAELIQLARRLLGTHVAGRANHRALLRLLDTTA